MRSQEKHIVEESSKNPEMFSATYNQDSGITHLKQSLSPQFT